MDGYVRKDQLERHEGVEVLPWDYLYRLAVSILSFRAGGEGALPPIVSTLGLCAELRFI